MRFGFVHRIMTDALATLGILALVLSGQFSRWVSVAILVGLAFALAVRESWQRHAVLRHVDTITLLGVMAVQLVRVFVFDANVLDTLVEFAAALQIIRLATRKGAAHDQQVIVLALLHLIAGTVLGGGLGYGLCFLGVLIVAPGALVLSHLRREVEGNYRQGARDRTGLPVDVPRILRSRRVVGKSFLAVTCLLSIPIFLFTAVLFVLFPRVGLSLLLMNRGHAGRMVGFSGHVDLGEVGMLRSDPALAMRITVPNLPEQPPQRVTLHLRGTALDAYDGRAWSQSQSFKVNAESDATLIALDKYPDVAVDKLYAIDLEPIDPPVVFLPQGATGMRFRTRAGQLVADSPLAATRGPEDEFRYSQLDDRGLKYDVFVSNQSKISFHKLNGAERGRYLQLPTDLPARIRKLAVDWSQTAATPQEKAAAIEWHLRNEYRYDLNTPSGKSKQPLDDFLFESKRGHCEYYSTAMAVLLRAVGVPTRNVTGFVGGTFNRFGHFYAVRQGDAHSWVEVFFDDQGWATFDPTPPADSAPKSELSGAWAYLRDLLEATSQRWDKHIVGYDLQQQVGLFQALTRRTRSHHSGTEPVWSRKVGAVLSIVFGGAVIIYLVARARMRKRPDPRDPTAARTASAMLATELYEQLEAAMSAQGVARTPATPPLKHAESLAALAHPLAEDVLELTQIYQEARFGGEILSDAQRQHYEQRVKSVRQAQLVPKT